MNGLAQQFECISDEVFYAREPLAHISANTVDQLKTQARANPSGKARICFHESPAAALHDMLIALRNGTSIAPHRHKRKSEAFHVVEGRMNVVLFDELGEVIHTLPLAAHGEPMAMRIGDGITFYCRIPTNVYHTVLPLSDTVVFREVTNGPFAADDTERAPWAWGPAQPR